MNGCDRFRLLATFVAGRTLEVAPARPGETAYTDGHVVFVTADAPADVQRREVLVQSALLGAGSLDRPMVNALRARPWVARRYLTLEGHRVLAALAGRVPSAGALCPDTRPRTTTAGESLELARRRTALDDPPTWYGAIRPSRLSPPRAGPAGRASDDDLRLRIVDGTEDGDDSGDERPNDSKILKLFEAPIVASHAVAEFLSTMFGTSRSTGDTEPGGDLQLGSIRRTDTAGVHARPLPTRIRFTDDDTPGAAVGVGGALHPEWDVFAQRYRPDWCRVLDYPLTASTDVSAFGVLRDDELRQRLSRIGLGPTTLRRRPDGDELDIEALTDLAVDLRSGYSPPENVYVETRKLARNLGVLILLDSSGSVTDTDVDGRAVHELQRRAAATMTATLADLGDRVAVYGFRSYSRHAVHLPAVKTFGQPFGAAGRARLDRLQPSGYTRLGAAIRGAGRILETEAGTPNRLLLVLSDGFPYDDGYEGRYAESDSAKALEELRADGIACLCLTIGAATDTGTLERVFGSASYAGAPTLAELSPRMDVLFLAALAELATGRVTSR